MISTYLSQLDHLDTVLLEDGDFRKFSKQRKVFEPCAKLLFCLSKCPSLRANDIKCSNNNSSSNIDNHNLLYNQTLHEFHKTTHYSKFFFPRSPFFSSGYLPSLWGFSCFGAWVTWKAEEYCSIRQLRDEEQYGKSSQMTSL